jgi:hypothetical protein
VTSRVKSGRWLTRRAWTADELVTLRRMAGEKATDASIAKALDRTEESIAMQRRNLRLVKYKKVEECPASFRDIAPGQTIDFLKRYYNCGYKSIRAWRLECGIDPQQVAKPKPRPIAVRVIKVAAQRSPNKPRSVSWGARPPVSIPTGDGSIAAAAANHLRRIGFTNVYRATFLDLGARRHLPEYGRCYYAVSGRGFMHENEVIAMAEARGFSWGVAA